MEGRMGKSGSQGNRVQVARRQMAEGGGQPVRRSLG